MRLFFAVVASAPSLALAYILFNVWLDPMAWDNGGWVPYGVGLLLMEFLILHSNVFITHYTATHTRFSDKLKSFAGLLALYSLMGAGFALSTDSPTLLIMLVTIMISRFISALRADSVQDGTFPRRAALGIVAYLLITAGTVFIPIPEMGVTASVLQEVYPNRGGGLWERLPHRPIVGAEVYFSLMGIAELYWGLRAPTAKAST